MKKLKYIGYILSLLIVGYVISLLFRIEVDFSKVDFSFHTLILIAACIIICCLTVYMFSVSWILILDYLGGKKLPFRELAALYVRTNLGKYLPGNVVHFAARNILGRRFGWQHHQIALSSFLEIAIIMITLSIILVFSIREEFIDIITNAYADFDIKWLYLGVAAVIIILVVLMIWKRNKIYSYISTIKKLLSIRFAGRILIISANYILLFVSLGAVLAILLKYVIGVDGTPINLLNITIIYSLAWVAGFVIIGAPGGIGVRETVLIVLLVPIYGDEAILAILLHRFISILGEIIAFLTTYWVGNKRQLLT